jgi:hypothetical protein
VALRPRLWPGVPLSQDVQFSVWIPYGSALRPSRDDGAELHASYNRCKRERVRRQWRAPRDAIASEREEGA